MFFHRKEPKCYDQENLEPVIRVSICTGEKTACFRNRHTGRIFEIMKISSAADLEEFRAEYGIVGEIRETY